MSSVWIQLDLELKGDNCMDSNSWYNFPWRRWKNIAVWSTLEESGGQNMACLSASLLTWSIKLQQTLRGSWACKAMSLHVKTACKIRFKNQDSLILVNIWTCYWASRPSWGPEWQCNLDHVFYPLMYHRVFTVILGILWKGVCHNSCYFCPLKFLDQSRLVGLLLFIVSGVVIASHIFFTFQLTSRREDSFILLTVCLSCAFMTSSNNHWMDTTI